MKSICIFVILFFLLVASKVFAGCGKNDHFLGAPSGKKMMSIFDITFSPAFAFSSTSGTSGCKNWDLVQMQQEQMQWLIGNWDQMLEDLARGQEESIVAFSNLLGCSSQATNIKWSLLQNYNVWSQQSHPLAFDDAKVLLRKIQLSLIQNSEIQKTCYLHAS